MHPAITLEALQVIDAIADKGSFAAAANSLYRVPSAITYTVQKLEQDLGIKVFIKKGRRSVLTPAGRVLLQKGRELLQAAEQLTFDVKEADSGWEAQLTIGVDTSFGIEGLLSSLSGLIAQRPEIELDISEFVLNGAWEALLNQDIDIAVGVPEKPKDILGVEVFPLITNEWVFAVAADHPLASLDKPLQQQDLTPYRQVVIKDQPNTIRPRDVRQLNFTRVIKVENLQ